MAANTKIMIELADESKATIDRVTEIVEQMFDDESFGTRLFHNNFIIELDYQISMDAIGEYILALEQELDSADIDYHEVIESTEDHEEEPRFDAFAQELLTKREEP